jgi:hypothetical protein
MVDGTGMCGGCRVKIGERIKFACVDGPDFDGHEVDFDDLMNRQPLLRRWCAEVPSNARPYFLRCVVLAVAVRAPVWARPPPTHRSGVT